MGDTLDRSQIVSGPGIIIFKGQTFYSEGDFNLQFANDSMVERKTSAYGVTDEAIMDRIAKISFKPTQISAGALPIMFPYGAAKFGDPIFTGTDYPVEIRTMNGKKITLASGAVTKCPSISLEAKESMLGDMEITCIGKNNTSWSDPASFVTISTAPWVDPGTYDLATILNQVYTASWAATGPWSAFNSETGFDVELDVKIQPLACDAVGTYNFLFDQLTVRCKCVPFPSGASPIAEAELVAALGWQGTGASRGKSLSQLPQTYDLAIVGSESAGQSPNRKLSFTVSKAALLSAGMQFGTGKLRNGEFGFQATRRISGGVVYPLYTITLT